MADLASQAKPAVAKLMQSDEDQLYEELGMRLKAYGTDLSVGSSFSPEVRYQAEVMGTMDDLRLFGRKYFRGVNENAYELICGKGLTDQQDRKKLEDAFKIGPSEVAAFMAGLLVTHLAIPAGIAAVVAAIVLKVFFKPALTAMCEVWATKIEPTKEKPAPKKTKSKKKKD